jgi:hypothetical protein
MGATGRAVERWVRRLPLGWVLFVGSLLVGVALLLASLHYQSLDTLLPAALVEIGAAFILLGPLLWLQRRLEDDLNAVKRRVEDTRAELVQAEARLDALTSSEEVSEAVAQRLAAAREEDETLFEAVAQTPSAEVMQRALMRAAELGVVSQRMPRVPLFDTHYVVRVVPEAAIGATSSPAEPQGDTWLRVNLEHGGGKVAHSFAWSETMSAIDLGEQIGKWLVKYKQYPGDIAFQPGTMFQELRDLLCRAHARVTGARGLVVDLKPVLQLFGDETSGDYWWITDAGVQRDGFMNTYTIPKDRFGELDWDRHVTSRHGVDVAAFRQAFETAQALHRNGLL